MATLIKERRIVADNWQLLKSAADKSMPAVPLTGDIIVPLALWLEHREALSFRVGRIGVWLDSHEESASIAGDLDRFALVAVNFSTFTDGRGFSIARLLRERHGYKGELRAIGEVARDHLYFMSQCGFDAFSLRAGEDPQAALSAFNDFSEGYQTSAARLQPLFRRRGAGKDGAAA